MESEDKKLVTLIEECTGEIARLELLLERQRELKINFEERLLAIRSGNAPIAKASDDILLLIFRELVREKPEAIGPVLLVCRHWNQLVHATPTLWTTIESFLEPFIPNIQTQISYLAAAISNSQGLPLNVTLSFPTDHRLWEEMAVTSYPRVFGPNHTEDEKNTHVANCVQWLEIAESYCPMSCSYLSSAGKVADSYFSILSDVHICRLKVFTLFFGGWDFSRWLHTSHDYPLRYLTPILEQLAVIEGDSGAPVFTKAIFTCPAPKLSRLSWRSVTPPEPILVDGMLNHLRFWLGKGTYSNFPKRSLTSNLHTLFLSVNYVPDHREWVPYHSRFTLPSLKDLTLVGTASSTIVNAPSLTTLRLLDPWIISHGLVTPPSYPSISKLHLSAQVDELPDLERFIDQHANLTEVRFVGLSEVVKKCMAEFKRKDLTVKGYEYSSEDYWTFDSYEHNEIEIDV